MGRRTAKEAAKARVGTVLDGKWRLDQLLGRGGSAAVYAATHRNGQRAAIKILHRHCASDPQLVARFIREGYLANSIRHPGVVSILDDDVAEDGSVYLVMELLAGVALDKRARHAPLPVADVLRVADQTLDVLVAAHARGLVHRDIKPANLFLTLDGQLKLLDFGIARLAGGTEGASAGATQNGTWMGTPSFMPPEQARARWAEVDGRSDLWALGATVIALLVGRRPRAAETANEELLLAMTSPLPSLASFLPGASEALVAWVDRSVAFERGDRFPDALAMKAALRELAPATPRVGWLSTTLRLPEGTDDSVPITFEDDRTIVTPPPRETIPEDRPSVAADLTDAAMHRSNAPPPPRASRWRTLAMGSAFCVLVGGGVVALAWQHDAAKRTTSGASTAPSARSEGRPTPNAPLERIDGTAPVAVGSASTIRDAPTPMADAGPVKDAKRPSSTRPKATILPAPAATPAASVESTSTFDSRY